MNKGNTETRNNKTFSMKDPSVSPSHKHWSLVAYWLCCAVATFVMGIIKPTIAAETTQLDTVRTVRVVSSPIIEGTTVSRYGMESVTISHSQIDDLNAQDIASAMRRTPGVTISRFNPVGSFGGASGGGIFIRGTGSSRPGGELQMLYDGVPRFNPLFSHPLLDIISIDPAMSINVYKGPQPQIFGNGHAAIDVRTKRMTEEGVFTRISSQFGSYNTFVQTAEHGGKKGRFDYYVGQSFRRSSGHRPHSKGQLKNYYARLGFQVSDNWNIAWFGNHTNNFAQDPGSRHNQPFNDGRYGTRDTFNTLTISNRYDKTEGWIKPYYTQGSARWDGETARLPNGQPSGAPDINTAFDWEMYGVRARQRFFPWRSGEIIMGLDVDAAQAKYENTNSVRWGRHRFTTTSPYVAISHQFGSRSGWYLIPSVGLRQYWHNEFDSKSSPHAGMIIGHKDTELHFGYARSIVYPGLNVVIFSEELAPIANRQGWRSLSPEVMDHYEVGLRRTFGPKVRAGITAFWNEGRDRYRMYTIPGIIGPAGFANIDHYKKHGFESSMTMTPADNLSVFVGAAYMHTEPTTMPFAPQWTLSAGANWRFLNDFQLRVDSMYRDRMYTGGYSRGLASTTTPVNVGKMFLLNAKLSHFFRIPSPFLQKGEVFVAAENITNTRYEFAPGYYMPRTFIMTGLSLIF